MSRIWPARPEVRAPEGSRERRVSAGGEQRGVRRNVMPHPARHRDRRWPPALEPSVPPDDPSHPLSVLEPYIDIYSICVRDSTGQEYFLIRYANQVILQVVPFAKGPDAAAVMSWLAGGRGTSAPVGGNGRVWRKKSLRPAAADG
jgi:hypothetical protein